MHYILWTNKNAASKEYGYEITTIRLISKKLN